MITSAIIGRQYTHKMYYSTCLFIYVQIGTNGIVSFGREYSHFNSEPFPTERAASYYAYVVAPFWADADARLEGAVYYETHTAGNSDISNERLDTVNAFILAVHEPFFGTWMMLVTWDRVHPFPHGFGGSTDPYVLSVSYAASRV